MLELLISIPIAALIFSGSWTFGDKILSWLGAEQRKPIHHPAALVLGFSALAYLIYGLSLFELLRPGPLWALVGVFGFLGVLSLRRRPESRPLQNLDPGFRRDDGLVKFILVSAFFFLILGAAKPEVFFDSWVYHLGLPELFLSQGHARPEAHHFFTVMPVMKEMISVLGFALHGETLAKLLIVILALAGPWALYAWLKEKENPWAVSAAALFLSTPLVFTSMRRTMNEPLMAAPLLLAMYAILEPNWFKKERSQALAAGLFTGILFALKYFSGPWCVLLFLLFIMRMRQTAQSGKATAEGLVGAQLASTNGVAGVFPLIAIFLLGSALPVLPWFFRSHAAFGDPLYPYLSMALGWLEPSESWRIGMNELRHWYPGLPRGLSDLMALVRGSFLDRTGAFFIGPAYAILLSLAFAGGKFQATGQGAQSGKATAEGLVGAQLASTNGVAGGFPLFGNRTRPLGVFLVLAWAAGLSQSHYLRYHSPLLAPTALFLFLLAAKLEGKALKIFKALTAVFLIFHLFWMLYGFRRSLDQKAMLGLISRSAYLDQKLGYYWKGLRWVQDNLPKNAKILVVGETRSYGFERRLIIASVHDTHPLGGWLERASNPEDLKEILKQQGITHLFLHQSELERLKGYRGFDLSPNASILWDQYLKSLPVLYHDPGQISIYSLP